MSQEVLLMDVSYLEKSYSKYKDKSGKKAKSLLKRIEASEGYNNVMTEHFNINLKT